LNLGKTFHNIDFFNKYPFNKYPLLNGGIKDKINNLFYKDYIVIPFLILIKLLVQLLLLNSGYKWMSGDDYSRTVISYQWLEHPKIFAGIWLSFHFWINGFFMLFIKDLFTAATLVNVLFSTATLYYLFKLTEEIFDRKTAFWGCIIFSVFSFQVWLSTSGLPESIYFFFVIAGIYYFIRFLETRNLYLLLFGSISFALSNGFRYEGWLFSIVFIILTTIDILRTKKITKEYILSILISLISLTTIFWWLLQNYFDFKDIFFFAKETARIYDSLNSAGAIQKFFQYSVFIFYIAPITTVLSLKLIYKIIRKNSFSLKFYYTLFCILELLFLMIQGLMGTGGTNMISRYIVINAILLIPIAVNQIFLFRRYVAVLVLSLTIIIYFIWCFYYPQAFRDDTYEVGYMLDKEFSKSPSKIKDKVYFEEIEGSYDIFPVQTLSNHPSKFVTGDLNQLSKSSKKTKAKTKDEELNILDLKNYFDRDSIAIAIVRSETYKDKLSKIALRNEEIGDYKIFYFRDRESNLNDSSIKIFSKNIISLSDYPSLINFNKLLAIREVKIDNTNFGFNPQSVTINWSSVNQGIIDSIDYDIFEFGRYVAVLDIKSSDDDSIVYTESKKIFSDRNIEDLIQYNSIRTIIIIKPFALLQYSLKSYKSPFESGTYNLSLKLRDSKYGNFLNLYSGDSVLTSQVDIKSKSKTDSLKSRRNLSAAIKEDSLQYSYNLGTIIAMFPDSDILNLKSKDKNELYRLLLSHGAQIIFSQRYQADFFLNYLFEYF